MNILYILMAVVVLLALLSIILIIRDISKQDKEIMRISFYSAMELVFKSKERPESKLKRSIIGLLLFLLISTFWNLWLAFIVLGVLALIKFVIYSLMFAIAFFNEYRLHNSNVESERPYYDNLTGLWYCRFPDRDIQVEEGGIDYVLGEFTGTGLIYHFRVRGERDHWHSFEAVLEEAVKNYDTFNIEGFEDEYSEQQLNMLECVIMSMVKNSKKQ